MGGWRRFRTAGALTLLGSLALTGGGRSQDGGPATLSEDAKLIHVLNRFAFGATADLLEQVRAQGGWRNWFQTQRKGGQPEPPALEERLRRYETLSMAMDEISDKYYAPPPKDATPREKAEARRRARIPTDDMLAWVLLRAAFSANPVRETAADFFRNHFSIDTGKGPVEQMAVDWEREIIHRMSLGNFGSILEATAKHPAMLYYLDNAVSRRPPTPEELRRIEERVKRRTGSEERAEEEVELARQRGLNENYARELLELHTLGVDNGYTQEDVIEVAKCLTGWTIGRARGGKGGFRFQPLMHCPGDKKFLGQTIRENPRNPIAEGEQILEILKKHEGTARFLAWKLCRYYVSDTPDEAMVGRIAEVFRKTNGDIPSVLTAIVEDPAFFAPENFRAKYKRPFEFVVSALRVTGAEVTGVRELLAALKRMNEPLYACPDPTGYYDQAEAWCDPGSIAYRWAFANDLAAGKIRGVRIPDSFYADLPPDAPGEWRERLAQKVLPIAGVGPDTAAAIDRLVAAERKSNPKAGPRQLGPAIVAALLGSPEFQKQ